MIGHDEYGNPADRLNESGVDAGAVAEIAAASYGAMKNLESAVVQMNQADPSFGSRINEVSEVIRSTPGLSELLVARPDLALRSADQILRGGAPASRPQYQPQPAPRSRVEMDPAYEHKQGVMERAYDRLHGVLSRQGYFSPGSVNNPQGY